MRDNINLSIIFNLVDGNKFCVDVEEVSREVLNIYTKPNHDTVIIDEVWINGKQKKPDSDPLYGEIIINKSRIETFRTDSNGKDGNANKIFAGVSGSGDIDAMI